MVYKYIDRNVRINTSEGPAGQFTRKFKDPKYVTDISDPNVLSEFASYNTIFTLSALSQSDMENMRTVLESSPHDIIARTGGIGPDANQSSPATDLRKAFDDASGNFTYRGGVIKTNDTDLWNESRDSNASQTITLYNEI